MKLMISLIQIKLIIGILKIRGQLLRVLSLQQENTLSHFLLFIAIMQDICGNLQLKWDKASRRRIGHPFGMNVGREHYRALTNLRFADDVLLVAQSKADISKMLKHFSELAWQYGLKLNFDKTKVLTWNHLSRRSSSITVGERPVEILDEFVAEKYLGRKLSFSNLHRTELENRIASAWAAFHMHKGRLCNKNYHVKDRIRLFDAVVSATL